MKIAQTELAMQSDHRALSRREEKETLRAWRGERPDFAGRDSALADISPAARRMLAAEPSRPPAPAVETCCGEAEAIAAAQEAVDNDPFLAMIRHMIEFLTGEKVRVFDMQEFSVEVRHTEVQATSTAQAASGNANWGMEYDYHATHEEHELTTFSAGGTIRTADGKEISFSLDLVMERHYREETNVSLRAGDAVRKDPLVINFGGTAVELAQHAGQAFRFDLDDDGSKESLPLFASGSGYLAIDLNGNGRIDSGRELFGPRSGNGFNDLARLDEDGSGWVDAGDAAFDRLRVWTPDAEGAGKLRSLAELGIGALGLAHVATPFALRGADNRDLGTVRSTGIYLTDGGTAGTLQEIDLTV